MLKIYFEHHKIYFRMLILSLYRDFRHNFLFLNHYCWYYSDIYNTF